MSFFQVAASTLFYCPSMRSGFLGNCFFCLDKGYWWLSCPQQRCNCTKGFCWTKAIISVCCSSAIWTSSQFLQPLLKPPVKCLGHTHGNSSCRLLQRTNCRPAWSTCNLGCKYFTKHREFLASPSHRAPALQFSSRARERGQFA